MRQMKDPLHAIFVPIGGGGLVSGVSAYIKSVYLEVKVIGVEPEGANSMALSLHYGERVTLETVDTFADGVAVKTVGEEPFRLCKDVAPIDGVILVSNEAISGCIKDLYEETRTIVEPSGAVSIAGAQAYCKYNDVKGKNIVAITSGANMDFSKLREIIELADIGRGKEAVFASVLPEKPGSFKSFYEKVGSLNITEFRYRFNPGKEAVVLYSIGVTHLAEVNELKKRMDSSEIKTYELTNNTFVKRHLRNMMGGRSSVEGEVFCRFVLPDRAGVLMEFVNALSHRWNISLFDYREQGEVIANVLVGLQMDESEMGEFHERASSVGLEYEVIADDFAFNLLVR